MIRPRSKPRRGEPTPLEKQQARIFARERTGGMCEYRMLDGQEVLGVRIEASPKCLVGPLQLEGDLFERGHLCHVKGKRRFGWRESKYQRHLWGCHECHAWEHNAGKPVPSKTGGSK